VIVRVVLNAFENDFAAVDLRRATAGDGGEFRVVLFGYLGYAAGGIVGAKRFF
jgi:hypothetical protein